MSSDPTTPRRRDEREQERPLDGDQPTRRPRERPGIDAPEIDRRPVGPEDEERKSPDDPSVS